MAIDIFILAVMIWAFFTGWRHGFLREAASISGFIVGFIIAGACYSALGQYLSMQGGETNALTSVIAFLVLWIMVPILLGMLARVLTKALKQAHLSFPNSLLGALMCGIKYLLLLSCVFNAMSTLHLIKNEKIEKSRLFIPTAKILSSAVDVCMRNIRKTSAEHKGTSAVFNMMTRQKQIPLKKAQCP